MSQDSKTSRDRVLKFMFNNLSQFASAKSNDRDFDEESDAEAKERMDFSTARDLIGALASWAGKGKDEVVQTLCREIGQAVAAVVKEPIDKILENRQFRITFEFVPKNEEAEPTAPPRKKTKAKKRRPSRARS